MTKAKTNYQDLLKIMALITMIIDHLGLFFFPEEMFLRIIGRYAAPIFCFFAGYNFTGKIRFSVIIHGAILYIIVLTLIFKTYIPANILISIFLGFLCIKAFDQYLKNFWSGYSLVIIFGCLLHITEPIFDYGSFAISIMLLGYMTKHLPDLRLLLSFAATSIGFLHTYFFFDIFNQTERICAVIVYCICFISLNIYPYGKRLSLNLTAISRNMLEIYSGHTLLIQFAWAYY